MFSNDTVKLLNFLGNPAHAPGSGHEHLVISKSDYLHIHLNRMVDYLGLRKFVFGGGGAKAGGDDGQEDGENEGARFEDSDVQGLTNKFLLDVNEEEIELSRQVRTWYEGAEIRM